MSCKFTFSSVLKLPQVKPNQRVNFTVKSYAPIVAALSPSSYPYRWAS